MTGLQCVACGALAIRAPGDVFQLLGRGDGVPEPIDDRGLRPRVRELEATVRELEARIQALQGRVADLTADLVALAEARDAQINASDRALAAIGDAELERDRARASARTAAARVKVQQQELARLYRITGEPELELRPEDVGPHERDTIDLSPTTEEMGIVAEGARE